MTRSVAIVAGASASGALVVGVTYGWHAALVMLVLLTIVGGIALAMAHFAATRRARTGPLRRQFALAVAIATGSILSAIALAVAFMFVSHHDALMVSVIAVAIGAVAIRAAELLARGVLRDVETVRDALVEVGLGRRDSRIVTGSQDELAELATAATVMVEQLAAEEQRRDAADRARRELVAAASHDLRTPLASLRLLVEAIEEGVIDDEARLRYLAEMRTHTTALSSLIDDLFELARLDAGDIEWSMHRVELRELVGETVGAMRAEGAARKVRVIAEIPPALAPAHANPEKLQRVLFNLIQNAIRHTPADGSVTVRAEPSGSLITVEVADTGLGVPASDRGRIFEPFHRAAAETIRASEGAGLGLAISRAIVEAHGGTIWLDEAQRGTRVLFTLPVAGGDAAAATPTR